MPIIPSAAISLITFPFSSKYPVIYSEVQNTNIAIISSLFGTFFVFAVANLFLPPFYIGLYKYKKNFDTFTLAQKPYWKVFTLYCITMLTAFGVSALTKYAHFTSYNLFDFYVIFLSCIYEVLFLIGFSWNIKIFNKLFWKITAIPYVLSVFAVPFFISDAFEQDYHFKEIILACPIAMVLAAILTIALIFILYKYAFREDN